MPSSLGSYLVTSEMDQCCVFCKLCSHLMKCDLINVYMYFEDTGWFLNL